MADEAIKFKQLGNECLKKKDYQGAYENYTKAISLDSTNHVFYANRAAALLSLEKYEEALKDALKSSEINPKYFKAYGRQGLALFHLQKYKESKIAYEKALSLNKSSIFQSQLEKVQNFIDINVDTIRERIKGLAKIKKLEDGAGQAREMLGQLNKIANIEDPLWLEAVGKLNAYLGKMAYAVCAWPGAYSHLEAAIHNLRKCGSKLAVADITDIQADFLVCKAKLGKEVTDKEIKTTVKESEAHFGQNAVRHAQSLELVARITIKQKNKGQETVDYLNTALAICKKYPDDNNAQLVTLHSNKALSNVYYSLRRLDLAKASQISV
eukprot:UN25390